MTRRCWTCNTEHDLDAACRQAPVSVSRRAAGGSDDLFEDDPAALGPKFIAGFDCEDACCGDGIIEGEEIRSDGQGGWIHATPTCERLGAA